MLRSALTAKRLNILKYAGVILALLGFALWYFKTQRVMDVILKNQRDLSVTGKQAPLNESP